MASLRIAPAIPFPLREKVPVPMEAGPRRTESGPRIRGSEAYSGPPSHCGSVVRMCMGPTEGLDLTTHSFIVYMGTMVPGGPTVRKPDKDLTTIQITKPVRDRLYRLKFRQTYDEFVDELCDLYESMERSAQK